MPNVNQTMLRERKASLIAKFITVTLVDDGNRYVVGHGDSRFGQRGKQIAVIAFKHDPGYEVVLQMDSGKTDSFTPGQLRLEQFYRS